MTRGEAGFHNSQDSPTRQSDLNNRKLSRVQSHQPRKQPSNNPLSNTTRNQCPECGSMKLWKDGLRYPRSNKGIATQRWLCRGCGYRFSQPKIKVNVGSQILESPYPQSDLTHDVVSKLGLAFKEFVNDIPLSRSKYVASHKCTAAEQGLNILRDYNSTCRVRVSEGEAKNLAKVEPLKNGSAGATKLSVKGKIVEFAWWMKKQGYSEETIRLHISALRTLHTRGANLYDSESAKEVIAKQNWSNARRRNVINAYTLFLKQNGIQ